MRILAIDPGRKTGFAFSSIKNQIEAKGTLDLGADAAGRPGKLATRIRELVALHEVTIIATEIATMGSAHAHVQRMLNELAGAIKTAGRDCGCEVWEFPIGTWKKLAVGKGNAKKPDVMRLLRVLYGIDVTDDNQADACGICLAAQQGPPPLSEKKETKRIERAIAKRQQTLFGTGRR